MAIAAYLAMTPTEFCAAAPEEPVAWMACHFSPYSPALSNLPETLPEGSLLMVNDSTPPAFHDPDLIRDQLCRVVEAHRCRGVILDFQRPGSRETAALCSRLCQALPCPTGVSSLYAGALNCPVFLPPLPLRLPAKSCLAPWKGREIWLEDSPSGEIFLITADGCQALPWQKPENPEGFRREPGLQCSFRTEPRDQALEITCFRTEEDRQALKSLLEEWGVTITVGLYQEWKA